MVADPSALLLHKPCVLAGERDEKERKKMRRKTRKTGTMSHICATRMDFSASAYNDRAEVAELEVVTARAGTNAGTRPRRDARRRARALSLREQILANASKVVLIARRSRRGARSKRTSRRKRSTCRLAVVDGVAASRALGSGRRVCRVFGAIAAA